MAQLIVPDSLRKDILHGVHEDVGGGHFGMEKTVAKLKDSTDLGTSTMFRVGVLLVANVIYSENYTTTW